MSYKQAIIKRHYDDGKVGNAHTIYPTASGCYVVKTAVSCNHHQAQKIPLKAALQVLGERKKRFPDTRYSMEVV